MRFFQAHLAARSIADALLQAEALNHIKGQEYMIEHLVQASNKELSALVAFMQKINNPPLDPPADEPDMEAPETPFSLDDIPF